MKNLLLGLVLGILLGSVPLAYTRQKPEQIYIGAARLQFGMEENAAVSQLAALGYKLTKLEKNRFNGVEGWKVAGKDQQTEEYDYLGTLGFKNARLTWAERQWAASYDAGSSKLGRNLYFLMKSFQDAGNTTCSIETLAEENADYEAKDSVLYCGKRTIALEVTRYQQGREITSLTESARTPLAAETAR